MELSTPVVRQGLLATVLALGLVFAFAQRRRDSTQEDALDDTGHPKVGASLRFEATAYCKGEVTAAGVAVREGIAAADPALLPLGSVVRIEAPVDRFNGIWTVLDTGPEVKGRELDLYVWSCDRALEFGRQSIQVTILRLGWEPQNSAPSSIERRFRRRESIRPAAPGLPPGASGTSGIDAPRG
jgi:3D (Asp-Asp-Asp) domain-containing protein